MASRASHFHQNDLAKAIRAAQAVAGPNVRVEIEPDGKIVVIIGSGASAPVRKSSFD